MIIYNFDIKRKIKTVQKCRLEYSIHSILIFHLSTIYTIYSFLSRLYSIFIACSTQ